MTDPQLYWPGDFPLPEDFVTLALFVAYCCLLASGPSSLPSRKLARFRRLARPCLFCAVLALLSAAPFFAEIYKRNIGPLAGLKAFLQVRESDLRRFEAAHPNLSREQIVKQFWTTDPGPWEFQIDPQYAPVVVYPTLMADGPRMAVDFGGRGSDFAIFDPDTMWVVFSL